MQLIPAMDLIAGRCVRLFKGDYGAVTHYDVAPAELVARYRSQGATLVHVVDLDGARDGQRANRRLIEELASSGGVHLQIGGGLRDAEHIEATLSAGAARAVIGSAAVTHADAAARWLGGFGSERIVFAFDVRFDDSGTPRLVTHGWQRESALSLWDAVERFASHGLRHVLCTDVGRDGALTGPNLALYAEAARRYPSIAWQASGGIRARADLTALEQTGVAAAISGKALLENRIAAEDIAAFAAATLAPTATPAAMGMAPTPRTSAASAAAAPLPGSSPFSQSA